MNKEKFQIFFLLLELIISLDIIQPHTISQGMKEITSRWHDSLSKIEIYSCDRTGVDKFPRY